MKNIDRNGRTRKASAVRRYRNIAAAALSLSVLISLCSCLETETQVDSIKSPEPVTTATATESKEESKTDTVETTAAETEPEEVETEPETEPETEGTYENNKYYDIVEEAAFKNSIGSTIMIHKLMAKEDICAEATVLAFADDGSVVGKSSDSIVLTKDKVNFFRFSFSEDVSNAQFQMQVNFKKDGILMGERNGVEMVQYNQSGDDLYITLKQTVDELDYFSKFKLILYKDGQIVGTEDGYFSVYAENLNGKDSTDVASIWVYGKDFDSIEYIFEP